MSDVQDTDLGWARIKRDLAKADGSFVSVGIHATEDGPHSGTTTAMIGAFHEFGTQHIPARPWLSTAIDDHRDEIEALSRGLRDAIATGEMSPEMALRKLSQFVESKTKMKIMNGDGSWAALSAATIAKKGSAKPLVDTSQLLGSIRGKVHMEGAA